MFSRIIRVLPILTFCFAAQLSATPVTITFGTGGTPGFTTGGPTVGPGTIPGTPALLTVRPGYTGLFGPVLGGFVTSDNRGYGVNNGFDLDNDIDGQGRDDFLLFNFDRVVTLTQIVFGDFDSDDGGGIARINSGSLSFIVPPVSAFGSPTLDLVGPNRTGSVFGVQAYQGDDSFRVRSLSFDDGVAIPEPGTWTMTLIGFVGIAVGVWSRRRNGRTLPAGRPEPLSR